MGCLEIRPAGKIPFVVVGSRLAMCHRHEGTTSCVGVLLHHYDAPVISVCFATSHVLMFC